MTAFFCCNNPNIFKFAIINYYMVKIYFVNCKALINGKIEKSVELEKGEHDILLMPVDKYSEAICSRIRVVGANSIVDSQRVTCDSATIIYIRDADHYILACNFPEYLTLPRGISQQAVNDCLLTFWRGNMRYLTVEKGDNYCIIPLHDTCEYVINAMDKGALCVCGEKHIVIISGECDIIADIHGDYDIGDKIQTVAEYHGIIGRTILENYSLSGELVGRKVIRNQSEYPSELLSHAFIESFIVGDIEFAHNMMSEDLSSDMDAVINFVGKPKRIVTDELPFQRDYVICEYSDGAVKVLKPQIENSKVVDIDIEE